MDCCKLLTVLGMTPGLTILCTAHDIALDNAYVSKYNSEHDSAVNYIAVEMTTVQHYNRIPDHLAEYIPTCLFTRLESLAH